MDAADSLVDYKLGKSSESDASKPKSKGKNKKREERSSKKEKDGGKAKPKADGQESKGKTTNSGSFICNGPHRAKDCPKREKLSALVAEGAKQRKWNLTLRAQHESILCNC